MHQTCAFLFFHLFCLDLVPPGEGSRVGGVPAPPHSSPPSPPPPQERRRAERAQQQRFRTEKEKERQARLAVGASGWEPRGSIHHILWGPPSPKKRSSRLRYSGTFPLEGTGTPTQAGCSRKKVFLAPVKAKSRESLLQARRDPAAPAHAVTKTPCFLVLSLGPSFCGCLGDQFVPACPGLPCSES